MADFFVPKGDSSAEYNVKNSRFISSIISVKSREEINSFLAETSKNHPQARHIVHAFVLGAKGELAGMSDDGEPHGTAGHPILDLLQGRNITEVLAVVVRYFGGTKLGTGGLVSAYSESVRLALDKLDLLPRIEWVHYSVSLPYSLYDEFRQSLLLMKGIVDSENFGTAIDLEIALPLKNRAEFKRNLLDLSRGSIVLY